MIIPQITLLPALVFCPCNRLTAWLLSSRSLSCPCEGGSQCISLEFTDVATLTLVDYPMLKLKTTVAACLALSAIGGIIACSSQMAKSGGEAKTGSTQSSASKTAGSAATAPLPSASQLAKADEAPVAATSASMAGNAAQNTSLTGSVQAAGNPIAGAAVTLYAAGTGTPTQLAQGQTDGDGMFKFDGGHAPEGSILYTIAKGGTPKAGGAKGPNAAIGLMAVMGGTLPKRVTVNEFTTIASAMTCTISEWRRTRR